MRTYLTCLKISRAFSPPKQYANPSVLPLEKNGNPFRKDATLQENAVIVVYNSSNRGPCIPELGGSKSRVASSLPRRQGVATGRDAFKRCERVSERVVSRFLGTVGSIEYMRARTRRGAHEFSSLITQRDAIRARDSLPGVVSPVRCFGAKYANLIT